MAEDTLLTVEEIAKRLSVNINSVRRWIQSGELVAIKLGGAAGYRVAQSEFDRFMRERQTQRKES